MMTSMEIWPNHWCLNYLASVILKIRRLLFNTNELSKKNIKDFKKRNEYKKKRNNVFASMLINKGKTLQKGQFCLLHPGPGHRYHGKMLVRTRQCNTFTPLLRRLFCRPAKSRDQIKFSSLTFIMSRWGVKTVLLITWLESLYEWGAPFYKYKISFSYIYIYILYIWVILLLSVVLQLLMLCSPVRIIL